MKTSILKDINQPIFYIVNDPLRAIGLEKLLPQYHIICMDDHPVINTMLKQGIKVFCLTRELLVSTHLFRNSANLLDQPLVINYIQSECRGHIPCILFFKPQLKTEKIVNQFGWHLLGNTVKLSSQFEDKIGFYQLGKKCNLPIINGEIGLLSDLKYSQLAKRYGLPFVVQFGRGWAGNSTFFIATEPDWNQLVVQRGKIMIKINRYVTGITVLVNAVIYGRHIFISSPAIQIRPEPILTSLPGATGGRQWPVILTHDQELQITNITRKAGEIMAAAGYRGFFGLDFIVDSSTDKIFLSENNARLTASAAFYTQLELTSDMFPLLGYHLLSFLGLDLPADRYHFDCCGSQIIARNNIKTNLTCANDFITGIYDNKLHLHKEDYYLSTNDLSRSFIHTVCKNQNIGPEVETIRLDTHNIVTDSQGYLTTNYREIITTVKNNLHLT